jgi:hypothetical protein
VRDFLSKTVPRAKHSATCNGDGPFGILDFHGSEWVIFGSNTQPRANHGLHATEMGHLGSWISMGRNESFLDQIHNQGPITAYMQRRWVIWDSGFSGIMARDFWVKYPTETQTRPTCNGNEEFRILDFQGVEMRNGFTILMSSLQ